jgi:fructose-1,6-bisphosphatase
MIYLAIVVRDFSLLELENPELHHSIITSRHMTESFPQPKNKYITSGYAVFGAHCRFNVHRLALLTNYHFL